MRLKRRRGDGVSATYLRSAKRSIEDRAELGEQWPKSRRLLWNCFEEAPEFCLNIKMPLKVCTSANKHHEF